MSNLEQRINEVLEDMKAMDITYLDVSKLTSITDGMFIASGNSSRHVISIANKLLTEVKRTHTDITSHTEGLQEGEWVLIDFGDIIVHIMLPDMRSFYKLEKLWTPIDDALSDNSAA